LSEPSCVRDRGSAQRLRDVECVRAFDRDAQVSLVGNGVAATDGFGQVPCHLRRDGTRDACAFEVPHGRAAAGELLGAPDGRVDVVKRCRTEDGRVIDAQGIARVVDTHSFAKPKVRFAPAFLSWLPLVWGDYWVVGLADDYSWAVVGSPDDKYLRILSRTPELSGQSYERALGSARDNGFPVERLVKTRQHLEIAAPRTDETHRGTERNPTASR
jgi:lipocalin